MKGFVRLVFVNLRRHKIRTAISVAGIGFGVAAMLTIVSIVLGAIGMFQGILATESQCVVFEKNVSDLFFSSVTMDSIRRLRELPSVAEVHPMLVGIVSSPDHPIMTCFGVEAADPRLLRATWLHGNLAGFDQVPNAVYLGTRAAAFLHAAAGETIHIGKGDFTVGGILRTSNGFEDGGVFMPMALAQAYFHRQGLASVATVKLRRPKDIPEFQRTVAVRFDDLIALENNDFNQSYSQFRILNFTSWAVGICAFMLGGMGVANTMLMSVFGRIREIAVLRVCGFSKSQVAGLVFGEAAAVAAIGVGSGFALGLIGLAAMNQAPQFQGYVQAVIRPEIVAAIVGIAFITALAGALYPAYYASKVQPAEALRFE